MDEFRTEAARWAAVVSNDANADRVFWYGVKTTGVVCRPSCPSRTPSRKNVMFFDQLSTALDDGFRHCKRCGS